MSSDTSVRDLSRRRIAADRLPPLSCGHRDAPLDCLRTPPSPSTFGLTSRQLTAEAHRRVAEGWQTWEVLARFARPAGVPTP